MRRADWLDGTLVFALSCAYLGLLPDCFQIADEGLVADTAERLYRGEVLYRDIFAYWNPGGFWLCAAVFHVAGVSVAALRISLLLFGAIAAVGVWRLARDHGGRPIAILAGLAAPLVCYPIWWMASPHWYSAFTAVAAAVALRRCLDPPHASPAVLAAGILSGLTFVILQPVGVFLCAAIGACLAWDGAWALSPAAAMRRVALFILGALLPVAAMYAYFATHDALGAMVYDTFFWNFGHYRPMVRSAYGDVHPLMRSDLPFHVTRWVLMVLPPVVYALALGITASRYVRRAVTQRDQRLFALAFVGIGLLGSNYYFPDVVHLAFGALPAFAVLVGLAARFGAENGRRGLAPGCAALLLVFVAFAGISALARERSRCSAELATPRGTIAVEPVQLRGLEGVVSFLGEQLSESEPFYVYPGGPGLNFLMGRPNPSPLEMGWPHIPGYYTGEQLSGLVSALDRSRVRYVVVLLALGRSALENSDAQLERYIRAHFRVAKRFPRALIMERDDQRARTGPEAFPPRGSEPGAASPSP
jgi:hypothetical protein